jgi:Zn-dependent M28 family amino/carboxypeptidase
VPADSTRFLTDLQRLVRERHPVSSPAALRETAEFLVERFTGLGLSVSRHAFPAFDGTYENVLATLVGEHVALPPLLLGAHYDTVTGSPGADDNASALAVLIEVAGRVSRLPLQRSVQFVAFCLEEEDLLGSRAYAADLIAGGQSLAGAVILECVGYASEIEGSQTIPPGLPIEVPTKGNFLAVIGNAHSQVLTASVTGALAKRLPVVPLIVPGNGEALPDTRRSDHTAFWEQGFPAVMLTDTADFRNPHYHRPSDTIETLTVGLLESLADGLADFCITWAGASPPQ